MSSIYKRFVRDSTVYSIQPLLTNAVGYFLIPLYTTYLSPADFGSLSFIMAVGSVFKCFVEMGLYTSFWKFKSKESGYDLSDVIYNITFTQLLIAVNILLLTFAFRSIIFNDATLGRLIFIYLIANTLSLLFHSVLVVYRARFEPKKYLAATVLSTLLLLSLNILFVAYFEMQYHGVLYSYFVGYAILVLLFMRVVTQSLRKPLNGVLIKQAIQYGYPIMIGNIASLCITIASRFFLKALTNDTELGLFSFGYKFGVLYHMIITNTFFVAWNALRWEIYEHEKGRVIFARFYKYALLAFPLLGMVLVPFLHVAASFMTRQPAYLSGLVIMPVVLFGYVFKSLYYFNAMGLLFASKNKMIMAIIISGGIINILLNMMLIRQTGMYGAAISIFITYLAMFAACRILSDRAYPIDRNPRMEACQILLIVATTAFYVFLFRTTSNVATIFIVSSAYCVAVIVLYFIVGFVNIAEIRSLRNILTRPR